MAQTQTLPSNIDAEQAYLGILINDISILADLDITPVYQDFFLERNAIIAKTIMEMTDSGKQVDLLSLSDTLQKSKMIDRVGGVPYLSELSDAGLSSKNVAYYVGIIIEKSQRRSIIKAAQNMLHAAKDESNSINKLIEESEKEIMTITNREKSNSYSTAQAQIFKFLQTVQDRMKRFKPGEYFGITTKFEKLDSFLTGFHDGELIILAARASIGKTAFTLNLINNISIEHAIPAAFFSLEMSGFDIIARMISLRTGIPGNKFRKNLVDATDVSRVIQSFGAKLNAPLYISDIPSMNIFDLRIQARRMVAKEGVKIIFIDYLGLIGYESTDNHKGGYIPRFEKVSEISKSLKSLARELQIPIVVLAQLNRESEGKAPTLANIRDSGAIEQDADVVMMLHKDNRNDTQVKLMILKHRNGPTGEINMEFRQSSMIFSESADSGSGFSAD